MAAPSVASLGVPCVVNTRTPSVPHMRFGANDLTVMGIAAAAAAAMGREQIVLAHQAEHPLAGNPDVATDPKSVPGRCLRLRPAAPGPRSRASALCRRLLGVLAGGHGVERGAGHAPGGAVQTRWARFRRPNLRLGLQQFHLHGQLSDPPIALALLERGADPSTFEPEDLYAQLSCTGSSRSRKRPRLRATVRWPSSGPAGKAWPEGRAKLARIYHSPSTATFFSKLSVIRLSSVSKEIG